MASREAKRMAEALWRLGQPTIVRVLDAMLATHLEGESDDELSPADETRLDAWVMRHRQRVREQPLKQRQRSSAGHRGRATS